MNNPVTKGSAGSCWVRLAARSPNWGESRCIPLPPSKGREYVNKAQPPFSNDRLSPRRVLPFMCEIATSSSRRHPGERSSGCSAVLTTCTALWCVVLYQVLSQPSLHLQHKTMKLIAWSPRAPEVIWLLQGHMANRWQKRTWITVFQEKNPTPVLFTLELFLAPQG